MASSVVVTLAGKVPDWSVVKAARKARKQEKQEKHMAEFSEFLAKHGLKQEIDAKSTMSNLSISSAEALLAIMSEVFARCIYIRRVPNKHLLVAMLMGKTGGFMPKNAALDMMEMVNYHDAIAHAPADSSEPLYDMNYGYYYKSDDDVWEEKMWKERIEKIAAQLPTNWTSSNLFELLQHMASFPELPRGLGDPYYLGTCGRVLGQRFDYDDGYSRFVSTGTRCI